MTKRSRLPRRAAIALASAILSGFGVLSGVGCSLLLHASPDQCTTTADCAARGAAFAGLACVSGSCVQAEETDAGTPCTKYLDCPSTTAVHPEVACDVDTQRCVQLTTDECPFVIGDYQGMAGPNPIFLGAFAGLPTEAPQTDVSYLNYALAQKDFASTGGIPAGSGGGLRIPVFVVCNNAGDIGAAMTHLTSDVHAPAVIAALSSKVLRTTFSNVNLSSSGTAPKVFFMNPYGADSTLTSLDTGGLLWHMLGQPSDLASAYKAVFPRVEAYARTLRGLDPAMPMKVATVTPQSTLPRDLNAAVNPVLSWKGGPATAANSANYLDVELSASTLDGVSISTINVMAAANQLAAFNPDVVLSYGSEEVVNLIETLEIISSSTRPVYVIGPYNGGSSTLTTWIANLDSKRNRFVGINYATTENNQVLADYQAHFSQAYGATASNQGDNYYDAAYFTLYALVAAGRLPDLSGTNIAQGMPHLVYSIGAPFDIGPTSIGDVLTALNSASTTGISLVDTIGPPDFNNTTGSRITPGDVYCINRNTQADADGGLNFDPYYEYDVLRPSSTGDAGAPLQGTFPCYEGF